MKRNSSFFSCIILCACAYMPAAHALSLGSVDIQSFLNQPLSFSIPLDKSSSEHWQAEDILVSLADADTYHQQGLAYPWSLGEITLTAEDGTEGQLVISGRSKKIVRDLVVALLVRVEWPKGSIQKEYTALIDVNGVTNLAPIRIEPEQVEPAAIQLVVQQGGDAKSVTVQPFSGEASVLATVDEEIERVELLEEWPEPVPTATPVEESLHPISPPVIQAVLEPKYSGYPSQDPVYLYKVERGDIISLLAQRFRGDVELPLHRYIHAINDENSDQYPKGMAELSIGELIRIPKPNDVAAAYTHSKRELLNPEENTSHHRYRVRYGDSLFLIAQAFKPKGTDTEAFMQTLIAENPEVLSVDKQSLRPRLELRIPNANYIEKTLELADAPVEEAPEQTLSAEESIEAEVIEPIIEASPVLADLPFPETLNTTEFLPVDSPLPLEPRRSLNPRLKANLRAIEEYVGSDEKNLVYEVIQTNNRLPLLYEQVIRLNQQISTLQLDMAELQVNNKQLQKQLDQARLQQLNNGASQRLQWFLLLMVVLLLVICAAMYGYIRKLAQGMDFKAKTTPLNEVVTPVQEVEQVKRQVEEKPRTPRIKNLLPSKPKKEAAEPVVVGEQDYSKYDISKSNYDYSQAYDVGALEEKMKTGENAFEQTPATVEFETYAENLNTVKQLINAQDFIAAEVLLNKLLAADSSRFDNWLARLELQVKTNKRQEADALYTQLQKMFVEPEQLAALENVKFPAQVLSPQECAEVSLPKASDHPMPDADKLYEVRVYLSYSHLDMAEMSINNLLKVNPLFPETLLLKLEWLVAKGQKAEFIQLQHELEQRRSELSEAEQCSFDKLCAESEFSHEEEATIFDDSTQVLSQFDADEDNTNLTALLDEGFDLDELEEIEEDSLIEAENDDEKEFLAAIQEQMESYTSEETENHSEPTAKDEDKPAIPDDIRIFD